MGGRFKNATPVTAHASFVATFLIFCINLNFGGMGGRFRQHDGVDAINLRQDKNPPGDNRGEGLLGWHPMVSRQGEIPKSLLIG